MEPKTPGLIYNGTDGSLNTNNVQVCQLIVDKTKGMFAGNMYCYTINKGKNVKIESWLGDSGATTNITNKLDRMMSTRECKINVTVSTREETTATTVGDVVLKPGSGEKIKILGILYVPTLKRNLLSTNHFTDNGVLQFANSERMEFWKGNQKIMLPMRKEDSANIYILEATCVVSEIVNEVAHNGKSKDIGASTMPTILKSIESDGAHGLCHLGEKPLKITFNVLGVKLTEKLKACERYKIRNSENCREEKRRFEKYGTYHTKIPTLL